MKRVLLTGGAGYVGSVLAPYLIDRGMEVVVYDTMWFGAPSLTSPYLHLVTGDIRDTDKFSQTCETFDVNSVIHLAAVANDPSFELNPALSKAVNYDCFEPLVIAAKNAGVKRFIYASSSSVYGVSDAPEVTEDHALLPVTDYNRYKGMSEPLLLRHEHPEFTTVVLRPATVCGYGPRQRLDLVVNIFTSQAIIDGKIKVFGGKQWRPNLHITDMCAAYAMMLRAPPDLIGGQVFNVGAGNMQVGEIAKVVRKIVPQEIATRMQGVYIETDGTVADNRSYIISSDKIRKTLGWSARLSIVDAVRDLCDAYRYGRLPLSFEDRHFNVRQMKAIGLA